MNSIAKNTGNMTWPLVGGTLRVSIDSHTLMEEITNAENTRRPPSGLRNCVCHNGERNFPADCRSPPGSQIAQPVTPFSDNAADVIVDVNADV